jgi:hypothetical protein
MSSVPPAAALGYGEATRSTANGLSMHIRFNPATDRTSSAECLRRPDNLAQASSS